MIECEICHRMYHFITATHLQKHGISLKEYRKRFPDAPIRSGERKFVKETKPKFKKDKPKFASIPLYEDGKTGSIPSNVPTNERFRNHREDRGWTIIQALNTLIDHDIELEEMKMKQKEADDIKKITEDLPENFTAFHRDELQRILKILEEKAKQEQDAMKLASIADKITKINLALPQLDKSYASDIDKKILEMTEKRKAICLNYLPEDKTFPWGTKINAKK